VFSETQDYTGRASLRLDLFLFSVVKSGWVSGGVYDRQRRRPSAGKGIGAAPMLKNNSAVGSLFWKHGIFHPLADSELQCGFRGNLDGFAGRRVPAFAGFSLGFYELSESWENKLTV